MPVTVCCDTNVTIMSAGVLWEQLSGYRSYVPTGISLDVNLVTKPKPINHLANSMEQSPQPQDPPVYMEEQPPQPPQTPQLFREVFPDASKPIQRWCHELLSTDGSPMRAHSQLQLHLAFEPLQRNQTRFIKMVIDAMFDVEVGVCDPVSTSLQRLEHTLATVLEGVAKDRGEPPGTHVAPPDMSALLNVVMIQLRLTIGMSILYTTCPLDSVCPASVSRARYHLKAVQQGMAEVKQTALMHSAACEADAPYVDPQRFLLVRFLLSRKWQMMLLALSGKLQCLQNSIEPALECFQLIMDKSDRSSAFAVLARLEMGRMQLSRLNIESAITMLEEALKTCCAAVDGPMSVERRMHLKVLTASARTLLGFARLMRFRVKENNEDVYWAHSMLTQGRDEMLEMRCWDGSFDRWIFACEGHIEHIEALMNVVLYTPGAVTFL